MALKISNPLKRSKPDVSAPDKTEASAKNPSAKKIKKFKAARGEKFVLFIGDEGAILVAIKNNVVLSRQYVPDASAGNLEELKATLDKNIKAPVLLAIDTIDQSYVQQTLPPVSSMSVGKLIKRRLDRDFGKDDIKGAIILGREKTGRKDWNFMMIALDKSPQLSAWLGFINSLENRFTGIFLVSVETETLVKNLDQSLGNAPTKENPGAEWKFFVSHNKVGGFRQVILRNGRIIFTRLAQPVGESTPEVLAGNIEQEMLSTIEYMKRLSYNSAAGLDIYIVASSAIKDAIDTSKFLASAAYLLTPFEVAEHLNIEGATQPTDQFGDVILAAFIGCTPKHILKFSLPQTKKLDTLYQLLIFQRSATLLGVLGMIGYSGYLALDLYEQSVKIEELEQKKVVEQRKFDDLRQEIKAANIDVDKVSDILDLYKLLKEELISPLPFIVKTQPIILSPVRIESIDWSFIDETGIAPGTTKRRGRQLIAPPPGTADPSIIPGSTKKILPQMTATLSLEVPVALEDPRALQTVQNKLLDGFKAEFKTPFFSVALPSAQSAPPAPSDNLDELKGAKKQGSAVIENSRLSDSKIQIIIKGDVIGGNTVIAPPGAKTTTPAPSVAAPEIPPAIPLPQAEGR